jgi:small subunit ribosomal protein S16
VAVRIRLKKMGRKHRPFFRVCAMDARSPRGGKVLEELGTYDPMVRDTDARALLNGERIDYWLGVGALPTEKVGVLIKKYGTGGTHLEQQKTALEKLHARGAYVSSGPALIKPEEPAEEQPAEQPAAEVPAEAAPAEGAPAEAEAPSAEQAPAAEAPAAEAPAETEGGEEKSEA